MKSYNAYLRKTLKKEPSLKGGIEFESWLLELSLNIARLRKEKGYSQEEFAKLLGMNQSAVARIESGQNMRCSTIWKISDLLEVDFEIFSTSKTLEQQKVTDFCEKPSGIKDIIGATAREDDLSYDVENIPFRNFNYISHAISYQ